MGGRRSWRIRETASGTKNDRAERQRWQVEPNRGPKTQGFKLKDSLRCGEGSLAEGMGFEPTIGV